MVTVSHHCPPAGIHLPLNPGLCSDSLRALWRLFPLPASPPTPLHAVTPFIPLVSAHRSLPQPLSQQGPHVPPLTAGQALPCAHPSAASLGLLKVQTRWEGPESTQQGVHKHLLESPGSFLPPLAAFAGGYKPFLPPEGLHPQTLLDSSALEHPMFTAGPCWDPGTSPGTHQWAMPRMLSICPSPPWCLPDA